MVDLEETKLFISSLTHTSSVNSPSLLWKEHQHSLHSLVILFGALACESVILFLQFLLQFQFCNKRASKQPA